MANLTCRLLPDQVAEGTWNMAADEALLYSAAAGVASLRFYGWQAATMSLGYFQVAAACQAYPGLGQLSIVRRASGGSTLVHHHEVTYALALPAEVSWPGNQTLGESLTGRIHVVIATALARLGILLHPCGLGEEVKHGEVLCFLHQTRDDLLLKGHKVVGSAQRKLRGAVMQHGGILLRQSPHTPELPGIAELAGITVTPTEAARAVEAELALNFGWNLVPGDWTSAETEHIDELIRTRYANPAWTYKR